MGKMDKQSSLVSEVTEMGGQVDTRLLQYQAGVGRIAITLYCVEPIYIYVRSKGLKRNARDC